MLLRGLELKNREFASNYTLLKQTIMKSVKFKGYTIQIWVAVCSTVTSGIIDEFDTLKEAKAYIKDEDLSSVAEIRYLAAEEIDKEGNTNPACRGKTRQEALSKL